ncbi:hypothetical protein V3F56_10660 [Moorellaceae bacterium AZ2]
MVEEIVLTSNLKILEALEVEIAGIEKELNACCAGPSSKIRVAVFHGRG